MHKFVSIFFFLFCLLVFGLSMYAFSLLSALNEFEQQKRMKKWGKLEWNDRKNVDHEKLTEWNYLKSAAIYWQFFVPPSLSHTHTAILLLLFLYPRIVIFVAQHLFYLFSFHAFRHLFLPLWIADIRSVFTIAQISEFHYFVHWIFFFYIYFFGRLSLSNARIHTSCCRNILLLNGISNI